MNKSLKNIIMLIAGNLFVAVGVMLFISPHGIILGGSTGISLIITHYFHLRLSIVVLIVNILLFFVGFIALGRKFALTTLASTLLYPAIMSLLEMIPIGNLTDNIMLAASFGGVLMGVGVGMILRTGGSSGGTDVIALILNKYTHLNLSMALYIVDGCILAVQVLFSNPEQILYGLFVLAMITISMNKVMLQGKSQIQLFIVSGKVEEIRRGILGEEDAGATLFQIEKGYSGEQGQCIMCVIPRRKLYAVNAMINQIDPEAFCTITEVNEVRGRGFTYDER